METKKCNKCEIIKSMDEFHKLAKSKDGRAYYCKKCAYESNVERNKKIKEDQTNTFLKAELEKLVNKNKEEFPDLVETLKEQDLKDVFDADKGHCKYSRKKLHMNKGKDIYARATYYRKNEEKPFTKENIGVYSVFMEILKGDMSIEEFEESMKSYM